MKEFKKVGQWAVGLLLVLGLTACGQQEDKVIKIGATVGPHAQVADAVAKEAEKQGIKVKVVEFSDYITPDAALADGSIDLNSYQHLPFLTNYNSNNSTDLVSMGKSILMRMGIYSRKYKTLADLPENARVAIPNDPTNEGRGLLLLESAGLITLKEGVGYKATLKDVATNPKNLELLEIDAAQLPRSLDDIDAAAITMNYVMSAGLNPAELGLYLEPKDAPLAVMIVAARKEDKDNENYKKVVNIFQSEAVHEFIQKTFNGTIEPAL
ncbi:MetQ/NlpA family ABC transporter substrate-binding protein [Vibrio sp.]|nr:MetQ/NlpA family ABC transporter substrate-binding protein [Vibrio sp.]